MKKSKALRVAIVGAQEEEHTIYMKKILESKGSAVEIIDTLRFPYCHSLTYYQGKIYYDLKPLQDICAYYIRASFISLPLSKIETRPDNDGWYLHYMAEREKHSFLTSWLRSLSLEGKLVVNPVESFDLHFLKLYQLRLLQKEGIPVPRTMVSNSSNAARLFLEEMKDVVYKPAGGGAPARKLSKELLTQRGEYLRNAPVIFQEFIPGENIRVFVLGEEVIAAFRIVAEELDYRGTERALEQIRMPTRVEEMCLKATRVCGMWFTGIDLRRRPDGEYVLIECNPSPMFLGFERQTGVSIGGKLANFLLTCGAS